MILTIAVSVELKANLDIYVEAYGRQYGPVDAVTLIPHMLAALMARNRGSKAMQAKPTTFKTN